MHATMIIRVLPLVVGLLPIIGVTTAYLISVRAGTVPACMPLLDGCTSISATGRYAPGNVPFAAALLPQAVFLSLLWWCSAAWLRQVAPAARSASIIVVCGLTGAVALVLYVAFLGTKQPFYEFMRHFGIYFYFLGTAVSQLLLTLAMNASCLRRAMLWVILTPFGLGVVNLIQKTIVSTPNNIENRIEWSAALLMQLWFLLLYFEWRKFAPTVRVR